MTRIVLDLSLDDAVVWPGKVIQLLQCVPGVTVHASKVGGLVELHTAEPSTKLFDPDPVWIS